MARPRKDQAYRFPTYNTSRQCWRLRIHHYHGEKTFDWPAPETATCPPSIIAAAVAVQDQWKQIQADWKPQYLMAMTLEDPSKDWSRPVWIEYSRVQAVVDRITVEGAKESRENYVSAVETVARGGLHRFVGTIQIPGVFDLSEEAEAKIRLKRPDIWDALHREGEQVRQ